jgi:hypothetical protein
MLQLWSISTGIKNIFYKNMKTKLERCNVWSALNFWTYSSCYIMGNDVSSATKGMRHADNAIKATIIPNVSVRPVASMRPNNDLC